MGLEVLANIIRKEREIRDKQIGKDKTKIIFFTDNNIVYLENLKEGNKKYVIYSNKYLKVEKTIHNGFKNMK